MLYECDFLEKYDMINYFDQRCKEEGFDGICLIERTMAYNNKKISKFRKECCQQTQYIHLREPNCSNVEYINKKYRILSKIWNHYMKKMRNLGWKYIEKYDGNKLFEIMTRKAFDKSIIRGVFFEWDNTPRHGYRGYIITPPTKQKFNKYMNSIRNTDYVFINAWNEWCEGMMLEPTKENGFRYLEWIREWSEKNENRIDGI